MTSTPSGRWRPFVVALALVGVLVGCSGDDDGGDGPGPEVASGPCASMGGLAARPAAKGGATSGASTTTAAPQAEVPSGKVRVLVFSRTEGFRHDSIEPGIEWFEAQEDDGFEVTATEEPDAFTEQGLAEFDVVVFLNTTGDVLGPDEQAAFETWLEGGGGYVGLHAAADTEYDWPWYGEMLGAWFTSHPLIFQEAEVTTEVADDPTVGHLEPTFTHTDEWYNFDRNPRDSADVLLSIDESTATYAHDGKPVTEFTMDGDHPVAWSRQQGGGRVWYSNLGHLKEDWDLDWFKEHVRAGVEWAAAPERISTRVVTEDIEAPVALDVADSGLVFWIERTGDLEVWDPASGTLRTAARLDTRVEGEGGLIGLRLAPDAAETGDVYLYRTMPSEGPEATNALQRLTFDDDCRLDQIKAETILEVPNQLAGHQGGDIQFLPDGTLLLATGDNTDNVADGYAPIGGTGEPETVDARRTSGSATDLRGKILRINTDGSIPEGNLFPADGSKGAPEIYVMGARNPYRIAVAPDGRIWWGDIGPDATAAGDRGPQGFDELNTSASPGDHGWPRCVGDRKPYLEHDLGTGVSGPPYDCADTVAPLIAYDYTALVEPALGRGFRDGADGELVLLGRSMMAGAWYAPGDDRTAALPLPDGVLLHEFARHLVLFATVDDDGAPTSWRRIAPWAGINTPIDLELGPNGEIYVLEHGAWSGITEGGPRLLRIEHVPSGRAAALPAVAREAEPADDGAPRSGGAVFTATCGSCHGNLGQGGLGPSFDGVHERLTDDEIVEVIRDGRGRMPAWGDDLTAEEIAAVAEFLKTLDSDTAEAEPED
jgi:cytochrome c